MQFGDKEYKMLMNLEMQRVADEKRIDSLEEDCTAHKLEIDSLKMVIANMIWASSKAALAVGTAFGGLVWLGYWLMDAIHWRAITGFFKALRGE